MIISNGEYNKNACLYKQRFPNRKAPADTVFKRLKSTNFKDKLAITWKRPEKEPQ